MACISPRSENGEIAYSFANNYGSNSRSSNEQKVYGNNSSANNEYN